MSSNHAQVPSMLMSPKKARRISAKPTIITPYYSEKLFGSSIGNRTTLLPTYREIGPPDLVHLSTSNRASQKEDGQYHYITGIDLSSTVAPQAYIQMLSLPLDVSVKHPAIFTYCSFNSFSKCDVRIKIECPEAEQGQFQLTVLPADRFQKTSRG
ncbi:Protein BCH2 AltName: Full=BUD7 and CHS6 homolog 2 [Cyberlindnera jadinii]|uniref:Uncharacterized protein n=1 Tax=Cyberlindnera jadinii (strain ATCC 18201 / CBS 1600 / BCRC 20928 / JCM 3617 / NBRC 0987 / NRRL Y-1542) TaxID=983966 RepID=A0A0H5CA30_CYBJN|nr:Protein BCH2 AltName: Full=BUD7 and CHS6 homolog 2 [Cyberlindnera jadinii]